MMKKYNKRQEVSRYRMNMKVREMKCHVSNAMLSSHIAQAVQDSIAINRLPVPEPTEFNRDPIHFVDWKASFMSLIDRKGISAADKLYYLKSMCVAQHTNILWAPFIEMMKPTKTLRTSLTKYMASPLSFKEHFRKNCLSGLKYNTMQKV